MRDPQGMAESCHGEQSDRAADMTQEEPTDTRSIRYAPRMEGLRVLVVDDCPISRQMAQHILAKEGADVLSLNDGRQAVDWPQVNHCCAKGKIPPTA